MHYDGDVHSSIDNDLLPAYRNVTSLEAVEYLFQVRFQPPYPTIPLLILPNLTAV